MSSNPLRGWSVDRSLIRNVGYDLQRPECILAERDGTLWSADARGGVMRISPDGTQTLVTQTIDTRFASSDSPERYMLQGTLPNGLTAEDLASNPAFKAKLQSAVKVRRVLPSRVSSRRR